MHLKHFTDRNDLSVARSCTFDTTKMSKRVRSINSIRGFVPKECWGYSGLARLKGSTKPFPGGDLATTSGIVSTSQQPTQDVSNPQHPSHSFAIFSHSLGSWTIYADVHGDEGDSADEALRELFGIQPFDRRTSNRTLLFFFRTLKVLSG